MRYNLTETHIAGIAAAVLAIIIIVVAVVLMSVAKPPDNSSGTYSPTSAGVETTEHNSIPVHTAPSDTATPTETPTTHPSPDVNGGINPQHVEITQLNECTADISTANYTIKNSNPDPVTITYSLHSSGADPTEVTVAGSSSKTITVAPAGHGDELMVVIPGTDADPRTFAMPTACDNEAQASVSFADQQSDGSVIEFENVAMPQGGFFVLEGGEKRIQSDYVDPREGGPMTLTMSSNPLTKTTELTVTLYQDTNENGEYDPTVDLPYKTNGEVVSSSATITVKGSASPTPTTTVAGS